METVRTDPQYISPPKRQDRDWLGNKQKATSINNELGGCAMPPSLVTPDTHYFDSIAVQTSCCALLVLCTAHAVAYHSHKSNRTFNPGCTP
jgi:hypothetical protein